MRHTSRFDQSISTGNLVAFSTLQPQRAAMAVCPAPSHGDER
jgi:hypothetical protein